MKPSSHNLYIMCLKVVSEAFMATIEQLSGKPVYRNNIVKSRALIGSKPRVYNAIENRQYLRFSQTQKWKQTFV